MHVLPGFGLLAARPRNFHRFQYQPKTVNHTLKLKAMDLFSYYTVFITCIFVLWLLFIIRMYKKMKE